ncbi:MAG: DUF6544 family protein [Pseudomonadota bacterium]
MTDWLWIIVLVLLADLIITVLVIAYARKGPRLAKRLSRLPAGPPADSLPALARNFAIRAGAEAEPSGVVRIQQSCELRFSPEGSWHEMTGDSRVSTAQTAFVWQGSLKRGPLTIVTVLDSLIGGEGLMQARLLSLLPMASATGEACDQAQALRYLGELAWAPDAILQNRALAWRELDPNRLEVSAMTPDGPTSLRLIFEAGDIVEVQADARPRATDGGLEPTPWQARFWDYQQIGPRRLPSKGEVAWILPEGPFVYWRGLVTDWRLDVGRG